MPNPREIEKAMTEDSEKTISEGMETLREIEEAWLAKAIGDSIANLGYPVGCGIAPHPDALKKAAKTLFDRYAKMIELARRAPRLP